MTVNNQPKKNNSFRTNAFRAGSYATFAAAIVLAIAIALNIAVGAIPTQSTQFDITSEDIFTLSDKTMRIVRSLDKDVKLYVLSAVNDADSRIDPLLDRYESLSDHVKVEYIDPSVYPRFSASYATETPTSGSIIVVCDETGKSRVIDLTEIYVETPKYTYSSFTGEYIQTSTSSSFNGEDEITSAINFTVSSDLPIIYALTGHGETALPDYVKEKLAYDNFELRDLSLLSAGAIPDDATGILICAPQSDLTQDEARQIREFLLYHNGDLILLTDYIQQGEMLNLLSVCESQGVTAMSGMVYESDAGYFSTYPMLLLPTLDSHAITKPLIDGGYRVLLPYAQGILQSTEEQAGTITNLMETTSQAYSKTAGYNASTMEPEDSDMVGIFYPAVAVESGTKKEHFVWITSAHLLDEEINNLSAGANLDLFMNALNWSCGKEESVAISSRSLDYEYLTVTSSQSTLWSILYVGAVPVVLALIGAAIMLRRKSR